MSAKFKLPLSVGLPAIVEQIKAAQKSASDSGTAVLELAQVLSTSLDEINSILLEKEDIQAAVLFTIPTDGWETESAESGGAAEDYPYRLDIMAEGILETDIVTVTVLPESCAAAQKAVFCSVEAVDGGFILRAQNVPEATIEAQYHVEPTVNYTTGEGDAEVEAGEEGA